MSRISKHMLAVCVVAMLVFTGCGQPVEKPHAKEDKNEFVKEYLDTITPETAEASGICGADLTWYYQDHVLVIEGSGPMTNYELLYDVPSPIFWHNSVYNYTTAPWSYDTRLFDKIEWVIIGEGVTSIGDYAFEGCPMISRLELPSTLTSIGDFAVSSPLLRSLKVPASVKTLKRLTFSGNIFFEGDPPQFISIDEPVDYPDSSVLMAANPSFYYTDSAPTEQVVYYTSDGFDWIAQESVRLFEEEKAKSIAKGYATFSEEDYWSRHFHWVKLEQP